MTKCLIWINIILYILMFFFSNNRIEDLFSLYHPLFDNRFEWYQIFTHMFIHSKEFFFHIVFNMIALSMFGKQLEHILGSKRFLCIYITSGIFAAIFQIFFNTVMTYYSINDISINKYSYNTGIIHLYDPTFSPMIGSSGAISGIIGSFAKIFPKHKIFIFPIPFPIKIRKAIIIFILFSIISSLLNIAPEVAHFAHIGGILSGYIISYFFLKKNHLFI